MDVYQMEDGSIVKPANAVRTWEEGQRWNGRNHISLATGSQWNHETLYRTRRGRYWVEESSQWQGSTPRARWLDPRDAARWLLANEHDLPGDMEHLRDEIEE